MLNGKNKYKMNKFGKVCYYLGQDANGTNYFLEAATWDCSWYWSGGYVETYTNNKNPAIADNIASHQHFDVLFFNNPLKNGFDAFKEFLTVNPFTDSEIWKICELMKSFYIIRNYSDTLHRGGAHYTSNPAADVIKNENEYKRINKTVIPAIMKELYSILEG